MDYENDLDLADSLGASDEEVEGTEEVEENGDEA